MQATDPTTHSGEDYHNFILKKKSWDFCFNIYGEIEANHPK
jgi:hypothetical protein